ncbi:MAG TPA: zf-TFIIB domain-containing protein [Allosphingosinicella sp.]
MPDRTGPMSCPVDGTQLVMSERQNIEIDYCPTCRGVWLDRGELDKIIERSTPPEPPQAPQAPQVPPAPHAPRAPYPQQGGPWADQGYGRHPYKKRRKSFLEELFD